MQKENLIARKFIEELAKEHSNAIPVFVYALGVATIDNLIDKLPDVIKSAKFYKWHEGIADTCKRFCHICMVDPALVEVYIGMRFTTLEKEIISLEV